MTKRIALLSLLLLPSCLGGSFRNHKELEDFPLREATKAEGKGLKRCLQASRYYMELRKEQKGEPYRRAADIPHQKYCKPYKMSLDQTEHGYELTAELTENESTVRWSIGENDVIEEHIEPKYDDELEF